MKGPITKAKLGLRIGALEIASTMAGLIVVVGLLIESGREVHRAWTAGAWPSRELWGGILVALGVFAEVTIGIFQERASKRERIASEERIAEAEMATAEANLARAKIEERLAELSSPRRIKEGDLLRLKQLLHSWAGLQIDVLVFDGFLFEVSLFAAQIDGLLSSADLSPRLLFCEGERIPGASLVVAVSKDLYVRAGPASQEQRLAITLAAEFQKLGIECTGLATGFDPKESNWRTIKGPDGGNPGGIAPVRIQIGAKQVIPLHQVL